MIQLDLHPDKLMTKPVPTVSYKPIQKDSTVFPAFKND